MTKTAAYGTQLQLGDGALQTETATVVGTITTSGDATFTVTCTGMTDSPLAVTVPVLEDDTATMVAGKAIAKLREKSQITSMFYISGTGPYVVLTRKVAEANIANLNIAFADDSSVGLTDDTTSDNTIAGGGAETFTTIAAVSAIGGPGLSLDVEDVTTHDQATAWEEVVATVLRSGELSADLVYDPTNATHAAGVGTLAALETERLANFKLIFPGAVTWSFSGYVVGFEPDSPVKGSLTAKVKIKLSGAPTLA